MAKFELLVGAEVFWRRAAEDMGTTTRRLFVQAMTFEGDHAGLRVASAIRSSGAVERRVLVDDYSRFVVSDRLVHSPAFLLDRAFRDEVTATWRMFRDLQSAGVGVRVTNPWGLLFKNYPARNHKKLIVCDDAAYIGGVNFSDHNFAWHDLMLRIEDREVADFLAADFAATFAGRTVPGQLNRGDMRVYAMDGRSNADAFRDIAALIEAARRTITVISPYLTFPFLDDLAVARARGVEVCLITPLPNNKKMVRDYMLTAARAAGFEIRLLPQMTHLKGMVIDDERLILGSSNFDFVSLSAEEELVAVVSDEGLVGDFRRQVVEPALAVALPPDAYRPSALAGTASRWTLKAADVFVRAARLAPRTAFERRW